MTKRLTECDIWEKDWFLDLSDKQKLLVKFLFDKCDCAGIYQISWRMLKIYFHESVEKSDFEKIKQVKFIDDNTVFLEDFIKFQYGVTINQLNPKFSVHRGILNRINKFPTLTKPLENSSQTVLYKDKDMDKDIDNNIIINKEEKKKKIDLSCSEDIEKCFKIYSENCKDLIHLNYERRNKKTLELLRDFLEETNYDYNYFKEVCIKANSLKEIANTKLDFKMVINNHVGIYSGKYEKKLDYSQFNFN